MIHAVILAAGGSSRFGKPKQLATYEGKSLIERAVDVALRSKADRVLVVVGANAERIQHEIKDQPVTVVYNPAWKQGRASSIRVGIQAAFESKDDVAAILFLTCDQPKVTVELLNQMIERFLRLGRPVASAYAGTIGIPTLIPEDLLGELQTLGHDCGAQELLRARIDDVETIRFEDGAFDIDSPEDLEELLSPPEN